MDKSNVDPVGLSGESTEEEYVIPMNNNSKDVTESDQEIKRAEDHWKYLVFGKKKNRSLQAMDNEKSNESSDGHSSSDEIRSTVIVEQGVAGETTSDMSKTNLSCNPNTSGPEEMSFDDNSKNKSVAGGSQQADKIDHRRRSVVFTSKRKLSSRGTGDEEFDDSGLVLDNSKEISTAIESDSVFDDKEPTSSKNSSIHNHSTSDEVEVSLDDGSKNEITAAENQQESKVERRRKGLASKRKLSSQEVEDQELDESGERAKKRGRGKYKLRDLSKNNVPDNVNKKEPHGKRGPNKSTKRNISEADTDDETEDSSVEMETGKYAAQNKDESPSKSQAAHNNKILKLINEGSPVKLRTLSRVGLKTAMMIHQYRKLNGKLESIRDLENMAGWSPRFFELFLSANNIILD